MAKTFRANCPDRCEVKIPDVKGSPTKPRCPHNALYWEVFDRPDRRVRQRRDPRTNPRPDPYLNRRRGERRVVDRVADPVVGNSINYIKEWKPSRYDIFYGLLVNPRFACRIDSEQWPEMRQPAKPRTADPLFDQIRPRLVFHKDAFRMLWPDPTIDGRRRRAVVPDGLTARVVQSPRVHPTQRSEFDRLVDQQAADGMARCFGCNADVPPTETDHDCQKNSTAARYQGSDSTDGSLIERCRRVVEEMWSQHIGRPIQREITDMDYRDLRSLILINEQQEARLQRVRRALALSGVLVDDESQAIETLEARLVSANTRIRKLEAERQDFRQTIKDVLKETGLSTGD
jgi:hypothetical protein